MDDTIKDIIDKRLALHINDGFALHECWETEAGILSEDVEATVDYILNDCDDDTLYWISEVFEEVIEKTKSQPLISALVQRCEKVSDAEKKKSIKAEIESAKETLQM